MSKFEESRPSHQVYEIHRPQGHGLLDQKHQKGNRSPISGSVPQVESGAEPGMNPAGAPGMPGMDYGMGPTGNM